MPKDGRGDPTAPWSPIECRRSPVESNFSGASRTSTLQPSWAGMTNNLPNPPTIRDLVGDSSTAPPGTLLVQEWPGIMSVPPNPPTIRDLSGSPSGGVGTQIYSSGRVGASALRRRRPTYWANGYVRPMWEVLRERPQLRNTTSAHQR
jgi:hypothetical protein